MNCGFGKLRQLATLVVLGVLVVLAQPPETAPTLTLPDDGDVIVYLKQSIGWHGQVLPLDRLAADPSDVMFLSDGQQISTEILQLSFDFARADAEIADRQKSPSSDSGQSSTSSRLTQAVSEAEQELKERQEELQPLKQQLTTAAGRKRTQLQAQVDAVQSEIDLEQTRSQTLRELLRVGDTGAKVAGGTLLSQVNALQRSVPELPPPPEASGAGASTGSSNAQKSSAPPQTFAPPPTIAVSNAQPSGGVISLIEQSIALNRKLHTIDQAALATDALAHAGQKFRTPLVQSLNTLEQQGDQALQQVESNPSATPQDTKRQLDALTAQYKEASNIVLPLGKQAILLGSYKATLGRWHDAVKSDYDAVLRLLLVRLAILAFVIILVITVSEFWRKAIFRYVHDVRRRYQFLLLRRILITVAIAIAVAFALASEIGSLATFVGLITAGIAVALQNVILAVAGYFFLIGKYGVRVGDRVQISGVTGDVLDIGLIRLHMIEVSDAAAGRQPTGRVVVFSNAIVFQPGASFFKQIPGTNFTWHQVTLILAPESDYRQVEKRLLGAVEEVYGDYRESMERQHRRMQESLSVVVGIPRPQSRLRLTQSGLEVVIRYPTELSNAAEIDDRVTRELLDAINKPPRLKLVGSGTPNIQAVPQPEAQTEQRAS